MDAKISKTEAEWKQELGPERYRVLRQAGTEPAFSGELLHNKETGVYRCGGCGVELIDDYGHGMHRVEVRCAHCKSHLGHVFDDGPKPTGQRFCMNSLALDFDGGKPAS